MGKSDKKTKTTTPAVPVAVVAAPPAVAKKDKKEKKAKKAPTPPPVESSSEEEESSDEESEEESKVSQVKAAPGASKKDDDDESSDEESSDEETPAAAAAAAESSEEESSDEEETPAAAAPTTKRKASPEAAAAAPQPKKTKPLKTATELTQNPPSKTLWIGNLSWGVDQPFLAGEFEQFGTIIGTRIQMDRETGKSRGIGYVEFETDASAQAAFAEGQKGMVVDGREIRVDWATQRDPNPEGRAKAFGDKRNPPAPTLWVGNLSFDLTEDKLWEAFSDHGKVSNVRMPLDRDTGNVKGFAYVEFASTDDAGKALEGLNGKDIGGRNCRIDYAPPRSEGGGDRGGFRGGRGGGDRGGRGGGRGGFSDRGGRGGGDRGGFGGRGRGSDRGFGDRGGRGGGRGRGANPARTGGISEFTGTKKSFDN